jgi:hypothetical protein
MIEVDIETALMNAAIEAAFQVGDLPLQVPNRVFNPPSDGRYLRATHFRNPVNNLAWGDETLFQGVLQIDMFGAPDVGSIPLTTIGSALSTYFRKGRQFREGNALVEIQEKPSVLSEATNGHETFVPVSIRYQCFG